MYNPAFFTRFPQHNWMLPKENDRNYIAAFFHLMVMALTCIAMAELSWFRIYRGECAPHLKLNQFFSFDGYFDTNVKNKHFRFSSFDDVIAAPVTVSYYSSTGVLACVTPKIANLMRILILLCFMVLIFSLIGFFLDVFGPSNKALRSIRRNALCSTFTVLWVVAIVGICYYITTMLGYDGGTPQKSIIVTYDYGCYMITAAGAMAVIGSASNLLLVHAMPPDDAQRRRLVDDWDDLDAINDPSPRERELTPELVTSSPPPYTP